MLKFIPKAGALKVYLDVIRYYLALVQFVLIGVGFIKYMDFDLWITVLTCITFPIGLMLLTYFHVKKIMPQEYGYMNRKNPATMKMLEMLERIESKL